MTDLSRKFTSNYCFELTTVFQIIYTFLSTKTIKNRGDKIVKIQYTHSTVVPKFNENTGECNNNSLRVILLFVSSFLMIMQSSERMN